MKKIFDFIRRERLYILLLIFVVLVNVLMISARDTKIKDKISVARVETPRIGDGLSLAREEVEKVFYEKRYLALLFSISSLLTLAILLLGIIVDILLLSSVFRGRKIDIATCRPERPARWDLWDVAKVVILFLFFGYMVVMIESALARVFPILKRENFRMIINSSFMDALTIVFILYFTIGQYKEKAVSLGISLKNFFRNICYGITGYVATVPILVSALIVIMAVTKIIHYVPERQPIVDVFLKEKGMSFLIYTSLFAAIVGPVIEELFFRGFIYNALKRYAGTIASAIITAAIFSALHTNIVGFLPIMILGLLLAYLYEKTGTLVAPITVHIIHNFTMVSYVFLIKQFQS